MEDKVKLIESLLEKVKEYGETSYELVKLKILDKVSDVVSTVLPHIIVFIFMAFFFLFINVGLALWLGTLLNETFYGFIIVASFYGLLVIVMYWFMRKWLKRKICNYLINKATKYIILCKE